MNEWFQRYAYAGCLQEDTPQQRLQKAIMVIAPSLLSFFCIFWVAGYYLLGKPISASIPGGYAIFSMASVVLFFKTKHYGFFRFSQIFLILCLPFLLQTSLGGFRAGSAVQMWAMLAPVGALMFQNTQAAAKWFAIFVLLTIICGFSESYLATHIEPLPDIAITTFFVFNFICAFFLIFICVHYYVVENKRILSIVREQADKLMEMDQIKNRFFANLSHEFRTPLALTIGPLEDAINGQFGEPGAALRKQLDVMLRNSRRLLRLINQLLDISKLESNEMKLEAVTSNLHHFANEILQAFTPYAERKQIALESETSHQHINISFDHEKMEKVLNNLLSNALKFTPEHGCVKLILEASDESGGVTIRVRDTGPGISADKLDRIFDRFYQVDGSSTRDHEGTGIGLSLVKELVELHGGTIAVKSEHGFGCEFIVFIPGKVTHVEGSDAHRKSHRTTDVEASILNEDASANVRSTPVKDALNTILVVDDNRDIREYLNTCLRNEFNVLQATNGREGLEMAERHHPDLIISDIMMPFMDGYQLCQAIKSDPGLDQIPVIFLTAKASEEMKIEGLKTGADDYLAKPFSTNELLARSRNLITLRRQAKELRFLNQQLEKQVKDQLDELIRNRRLSSYFSGKLLQSILSQEEAADLVTKRSNITIFFSDLCNFTDMTDRMESEKATTLLNEYLSETAALVENHGATVVQIIGDAIMVFFGAPDEMDSKEQAIKAVELGIAMQNKVKELSASWLSRGLEYEGRARIGIHQDYVTVGNFGSHNLMEYTAVGRGVNLAARLEASCTPGNIKVSHPVYLLTSELFNYGPLKDENFKGFSRQIKVCELMPS